MASELESDLKDTVDWGKKWLVDFNSRKTQLVLFDQSNNTGSIDLRMDVSVLEEKSFFKMLRLTFSSKLNWGSYIGASLFLKCIQENWSLIHLMKFLSTEITLCIYKSTIWSCIEYCCNIWAGALVATC